MTWTLPPAGFIAGSFDGALNGRSQTIEPTGELLHCDAGGGATFPCPVNASRGDVLFLPIAESLAVWADVYDWYVLSIIVDFPAVSQGSLSCIPRPSVYQPCARDDIAHSFGQLGYWRATGGGFEAVPGLTFGLVRYSTGEVMPDSGAADGNPPAHGVPSDFGTAPAWSLGRFSESGTVNLAIVINPDPLFPVPDDTGNVAGQALWTRSQLAAADGVLGLFWATEGVEGTSNLGATVSIQGLSDVDVPVTFPGHGVIAAGQPISGVVRRGNSAPIPGA